MLQLHTYCSLKNPEDILCEVVLLAVDHDWHTPLWIAAAIAALDVLDHVREILRFLRHLSVHPLQELEVFHRPTLFPLLTEVVLKQLVMLKSPISTQADADELRNRTLLRSQSRLLLWYLDMADKYVAGDESRGVLCAFHLHLNVPKCFLVFIPVDTVRLLWTRWHKKTSVFTIFVQRACIVYSICK